MKFALDAMGGDFAPKSVVMGGLNAIEKALSPIKITTNLGTIPSFFNFIILSFNRE